MISAVIFDMFETLVTHYRCPLYFGSDMAADAGIPEERFLTLWRPAEHDRSIGKITLEEILERILRENQCYSAELLEKLVRKRMETKQECFRRLHPEILPMLSGLREKNIPLGLISNCYSEETKVIRKSELLPYFNAAFLSFEQGVAKPDREIFDRCTAALSVKAEECLYVGDGASFELETAKSLGMTAVQAVWYQPSQRNPDFQQLERPSDVLRLAAPGEDSSQHLED